MSTTTAAPSQPLHPLQVLKRLTESYTFTHFFIHLQMDSQPSTSSGAMDQRRKDALKVYTEVGLLIHLPASFTDYHWCTENEKCQPECRPGTT
jgi:hypothetical protein